MNRLSKVLRLNCNQFGNIIVKASFSENILNCSNISEGGLPESSVAQSAINIGCQIIDVNNDISHKTRNGKMHPTVVTFFNCIILKFR